MAVSTELQPEGHPKYHKKEAFRRDRSKAEARLIGDDQKRSERSISEKSSHEIEKAIPDERLLVDIYHIKILDGFLLSSLEGHLINIFILILRYLAILRVWKEPMTGWLVYRSIHEK